MLLRERGAEAQRERNQNPNSGFEQGRALAYIEVLSLMQNQADAFGLDREQLCLSGFEPLTGKLDPPAPQPVRDL
jgi:hypothetical protein